MLNKIKGRLVEEYLYWFKGFEVGPHIERRMLRFQNKVNRMMKRRGIALIAQIVGPKMVSLSYVPEREWNAQKDVMEQELKAEGDKINEHTS